ncbi:glycoside hydrolase family 12 protein [Mixia osmundae IAM 14324]|uniref:Glycoside hydrolase 131 catalytic N-terminal domain-containing protein n=1 Tax=Mixia osmundae (strain CBS 9802 / IAM 14324 / JCM 22182 / KY 12970) TaxID=764103 RepID=G7E0G1_MIXOS|nr:glycoside hydrolase family 12 protein [Mixia osmundae IAM 14324]KEI38330.1 glycoside hydrolase family 12 protein [Mixia osmundae IAM 14324]GAA96321.1 hypothetical protein E5Q_02987 [Mixia osmundae IAM 14324]
MFARAIVVAGLASSAIAASQQFTDVCEKGYVVESLELANNGGKGLTSLHLRPCPATGEAAFGAIFDWSGADLTVKSYPNAAITVGLNKPIASYKSIPLYMNWNWLKDPSAIQAFTGLQIHHSGIQIKITLSYRGAMAPGQLVATPVIGGKQFKLYKDEPSQTWSYLNDGFTGTDFYAEGLDFVNDAAKQGAALTGDLTAVSAGTEIFKGEGIFLLNAFTCVPY